MIETKGKDLNKRIKLKQCRLRCWITNPGTPYSKPLGCSKVDAVFHPSEVDQISTRNFWELNGEK